MPCVVVWKGVLLEVDEGLGGGSGLGERGGRGGDGGLIVLDPLNVAAAFWGCQLLSMLLIERGVRLSKRLDDPLSNAIAFSSICVTWLVDRVRNSRRCTTSNWPLNCSGKGS